MKVRPPSCYYLTCGNHNSLRCVKMKSFEKSENKKHIQPKEKIYIDEKSQDENLQDENSQEIIRQKIYKLYEKKKNLK